MSRNDTFAISSPDTNPIRVARKRRGLSQEALAEKLGSTKATVSKWERGATYPEPATAFRIASMLKIRFEDIFEKARGA